MLVRIEEEHMKMAARFLKTLKETPDPDGGKLTREEALFTNQKLGQIRSLPRGAAFESPIAEDEDYADGRVAAETIQRLRAAKARRDDDDTPSFITAGFVRPHLPFCAPKKYWDLFDPKKLPMPAHESAPKDASDFAVKRGGEITAHKPVPVGGEIVDELKRQLIHGYYASTSFVDAQIGKVIDKLDRLKMTDNTIVVLWGDHGSPKFLSESPPLRRFKPEIWDGGIRVPTFFTGPGIAGKWKLVAWYETGDVHLFDLDVDISETTDVSKQHPEVKRDLWVRLRNYLSRVDANMPTLDPMHESHTDAKDGDADNDGLPDEWEFRQLLTHSLGPDDDPDQDGRNNLVELNSKSDPLMSN